jgi:hypothetical protein
MKPLESRQRFSWLLAAAFLSVAFLTRIALLVKAGPDISWNASLAGAFALGLVFDLGTLALLLLPIVLLLALLPARCFRWRASRWIGAFALHASVYLLLFGAVAEVLFWDEFGTRFNFIAVDYLVYTTEVVGNIRESYPLGWILSGAAAATVALCAALRALARRVEWSPAGPVRAGWRTPAAAAGLALLTLALLNEGRLPAFGNNYNRELAKNGL